MSKASAFRTELYVIQERRSKPIGAIASVTALLVLVAMLGVAEISLLPTLPTDDVGSILFGAG